LHLASTEFVSLSQKIEEEEEVITSILKISNSVLFWVTANLYIYRIIYILKNIFLEVENYIILQPNILITNPILKTIKLHT
jgi:hypothetical protein